MNKLIFALLTLVIASNLASAQSQAVSTKPDETLRHNDSLILANTILPVVNNRSAVPNWDALAADVKAKYGDTYVDRSVTKAQIFYYYSKDWPLFSKALVHFTEAYEDKDDLKLMNKNAKMVLQYSQNPDEWKSAISWMKHAVDKAPENTGYKETYDALTMKVKGKIASGGL